MYGWAFVCQCLAAYQTLVNKNGKATLNEVRDLLIQNGLEQDKTLVYRRVWSIFSNLLENGLVDRSKESSSHMAPFYYSPTDKLVFINVESRTNTTGAA